MAKYGVSLKWLAVTSFELNFDGFHVVSDPYITECVGTELDWQAVDACDAICLSHAHWDHITDIPRLMDRFKPILMCGEMTSLPMVRWLNCSPTVVYPMYPDTELDFGKVKIRSLYGRHTNLGLNHSDLMARLAERDLCQKDPGIGALQEIGSFEYRNFLFTTPSGTKILIWGNNPTPEQVNLCKEIAPDIAIIQRSIKPQDVVKKAEFAAAIGCKILIPHHHDFKGVDAPDAINLFRDEFLKLKPDATFISPKHGEWIEL